MSKETEELVKNIVKGKNKDDIKKNLKDILKVKVIDRINNSKE